MNIYEDDENESEDNANDGLSTTDESGVNSDDCGNDEEGTEDA